MPPKNMEKVKAFSGGTPRQGLLTMIYYKEVE